MAVNDAGNLMLCLCVMPGNMPPNAAWPDGQKKQSIGNAAWRQTDLPQTDKPAVGHADAWRFTVNFTGHCFFTCKVVYLGNRFSR